MNLPPSQYLPKGDTIFAEVVSPSTSSLRLGIEYSILYIFPFVDCPDKGFAYRWRGDTVSRGGLLRAMNGVIKKRDLSRLEKIIREHGYDIID